MLSIHTHLCTNLANFLQSLLYYEYQIAYVIKPNLIFNLPIRTSSDERQLPKWQTVRLIKSRNLN